MERIIDEMLERDEYKDRGLSRYEMLVMMYENLSKRMDSTVKAVDQANEKYLKTMETVASQVTQLELANTQLVGQQHASQLLADERNKQESRHAEQIEDLMKKNRALEAALNGNNN